MFIVTNEIKDLAYFKQRDVIASVYIKNNNEEVVIKVEPWFFDYNSMAMLINKF